MQIEFLGANQNVTGSMHLLHVNGRKILLECGLFQGHREEAFERNRHLPFEAADIDVMVLSHAHIDHSGNIPNLVRSGYEGGIYATHATHDLCSIMLRDTAYILESDVAYLNKRRKRRGEPPLEPTYTAADATRSLSLFFGVGYHRPVLITPDVQLTFFDAGHILGSALTALDITENGERYRLLFTGDLGRPGLLILRDPEVVPDVDFLITESTYGDRTHGTPQEAEAALERVVNETYDRRGKLIIPAFSVGRTQELVYALHRLTVAGGIPHLPIYVDSPLSTNATDVFRLHPGDYDDETREFMQTHRDPFGFAGLRYLRHAEDSKALNTRDEPMVIISASGMCEAGRILHHLKNNIENPRNTVLFVSFQAEHTLGRRILEGQDEVPILGDKYKVHARVEHIDGYSAHADRNELLSYIGALGPRRIQAAYVVHGEEPASAALSASMTEIGLRSVHIPTRGQVLSTH
ncbi:MAG: MBL fold metallo-hydrolase [Chloroflexi bacterium]|nr:MBL fold metallo-hydrolase [Chloroflexota bacterium]